MLVPPYGSIQPKANETSYQGKGPAAFCSQGIRICKESSLSRSPILSISLPTAHPWNLPSTSTGNCHRTAVALTKGIKSLHFQDVDFILYSILHAHEYRMDIKSTFVSPRKKTDEVEGNKIHWAF